MEGLTGLGAVGGDEGLEVVTKDEIRRIRVDAAKETIELLKKGYVSQGHVLARIAAGPSGQMVDAGTTTTDDLRVVRSIEVATSPVRSDGGDGIEWVEMSSVKSSVDGMERSSVWSSGMEEDEEYGGEWEGGETLVEMPDEEGEDEEMEEEMEG
ncbi:hypothetical protein LTR27_007345 [Elasticomyces elasticus]|nr:hypothetical protein LTR27_007345 [Elasticomyces elasticus]